MFLNNLIHKIRGDNAQVDFYAKVYTALIISTNIPRATLGERTLKFCSLMFKEKDQRNFFTSCATRYIEIGDRSDININQLISKIDREYKANPEWITKLSDEAIDVCKSENDGLQDRVIEYIATLKSTVKK
ncbi:MAG: hypothetical protein LBN32_01890 [Helicobacteraceae bacterium]|jgi:hypothetical protein|nr:hypothetical protein [Helicobacteraceae bacterium]